MDARERQRSVVVEMFQAENPNVKVIHSIISDEDFKAAIRAYLQASPPPDVLTWYAGNRMRFFVSKNLIMPYYRDKAFQTMELFIDAMADLPFYVHKPEGAIFLWLWVPDLPITSEELYQRLKKRGVLVISGHHFFPGLQDDWRHKHECIRITYSMDPQTVEKGIKIHLIYWQLPNTIASLCILLITRPVPERKVSVKDDFLVRGYRQ